MDSKRDDESNFETQFLEATKSNKNGISNSELKKQFSYVSLTTLTAVINRCLKNGTIELFKTKNDLLYKFKDLSAKSVVKGSDNEEKIVYKIIEKAGNKGIWIRDIRVQSNINQTQLNKILKSLETKKDIKAVKSVTAGKKKLYMLYDLEPDSSVTGGAWYQDQDFESEFVDILSQQCHRFLVQKKEEAVKQGGGPLLVHTKSFVSVEEVHKFIADLGISKIQLSHKDIESILYTVVLDGNAERKPGPSTTFLYKAANKFLDSPGLVRTTCGVCSISHRCASVGSINPTCCTYLNEWLN